MLAVGERIYSVKEYFDLEATSQIRHEFYYGKLTPMPGESQNANTISLNCAFALKTSLKGKGYKVNAHDVRTIVKGGEIYRYPDVVVTPLNDISDSHALTQPVLIIEVLSENSVQIDRGIKLREYCSIPSLHYYLIIAQDQKLVELYSRQDQKFIYSIFSLEQDTIDLPHLGIILKMDEIYEDIAFE